jgi:small conductance mechanosensitive channel
VDSLLDKLKNGALSLSKVAIDNLEKVIAAFAIVLAGIVIARITRRWVAKALPKSRFRLDSLLESFLMRLSYTGIVAVSIILALRMFMNIETFLTGLGVTGFILGFGLRDTLSNLASGFLLLIYRPFRAGETIEVEGSIGVVNELTIVNMEMTTTDGVRVTMPNSRVWGAKITNYSLSKQRRIELTLKLWKQDLEPAIGVIRSALDRDERILKAPEPTIRISSILDQIGTVTIWAWVLPPDYISALNDEYIRLLDALRRSGITTA